MEEDNKKPFPQKIISTALEGSEYLSEGFPSWARPTLRIAFFALLVLLFLLLTPFGLMLALIKKRRPDAYFRLESEMNTNWKSGAHEDSLLELRSVREKLKNRRHDLKAMFKGIEIPPYGRFMPDDYNKVLWMLYHWEYDFEHYKEASDICDEVLVHLTVERVRKFSFYEHGLSRRRGSW